jgi:hypothetical protein
MCGKYDPTPSPRLAEPPPRYNTARMNRHDGPEDGALADRCLTGGLPEFGAATGSFRRIVQTPGGTPNGGCWQPLRNATTVPWSGRQI